MRPIETLVAPWRVENLSLRPFPGFYSFNPSIHFDGDAWRVMMRNADYHAPNGVVIAQRKGGRVTTRNALVTLDPKTWQPIASREVAELDGLLRFDSSSMGFEDVRLFRTEADGLLGLATTMQLRRDQKQEMVILRFSGEGDVCEALPIRGAWSDTPQKNWMPFDGAIGPRFLYSIEREIVFDASGPISGKHLPARELASVPATPPAAPAHQLRYNGGVETRLSPRTVRMARAGEEGAPKAPQAAKTPGWATSGLRGGSQLLSLGDRWLGIGHEMRWTGGRKHYWHVLFTCDDAGHLLERSEPMKLSTCGIEFAAGMAYDPDSDQVVISYGTEDQDSWLGFTRLEPLLDILRPIREDQAMQRAQ